MANGGGSGTGHGPAGRAEGDTLFLGDQATVREVRELAGSPKRVSVIVGRRRAATLLPAQAEELGIRPGVAWTASLAAAAQRAERVNHAKSLAMRRLAARARTRRELIDSLVGKGVALDIAHEAIDRLAEVGLVSDRQVATAEAERGTARGLSERAVRHAQETRGIAEEDRAAPAGSERERALEVARAEVARRKGEREAQAVARRVLGVLGRKGYEEDVAREAVAQACREAGIRVDMAE